MGRTFLLLSLLAVPFLGKAQSFYSVRKERNSIVYGGFNTSTYLGDLKDNSDLFDPKPSITVGGLRYYTNRIGVRGEFSWINLAGKDSESKDNGRVLRNLSFQSSCYEFNAQAIINLRPTGKRFYQRPVFNLYGFVGAGLVYFNPMAKDASGNKVALKNLKTEGATYSNFAMLIPFGFGGKYMINPFVNICTEVGWRKSFTDYMDDVSTVYLDNASFTDPVAAAMADRGPEIGRALKAPGSIRGNPKNKDGYLLYSFKIEYYLPYDIWGTQNRKLYTAKRKQTYRRRR